MTPRCHRFPRRLLGATVAVASVLMLSVPACSPEATSSVATSPKKTAPEKTPPTKDDAPQDPTPPTPKMPAGWKVVEDHLFTGADLTSIAQNLGVELTGLRNTMFDVGGKPVKVNTLVAADATNAAATMTSMGDKKPVEFLLRKGLYIHEFVCKDDAIPHVREGKKHLAGK